MFFSVGEVATSKWTHGEVAVFGSTVYKIFALKCQKLRTPLASPAPCVNIFMFNNLIHKSFNWTTFFRVVIVVKHKQLCRSRHCHSDYMSSIVILLTTNKLTDIRRVTDLCLLYTSDAADE